jgi:hypothetical protein
LALRALFGSSPAPLRLAPPNHREASPCAVVTPASPRFRHAPAIGGTALRLAFYLTVVPTLQSVEQRRIATGRLPCLVFIMKLGLEKLAVQQRLEAVRGHATPAVSGEFSAGDSGIRLFGISIP